MKSVADFLRSAVVKREEIDRFLDPDEPNWATFDRELGYVLQDGVFRDGLDGAYTIGRYDESGERRSVNFAGRPCRINTYGNSFTQCHQVSDGETWQEYLAAHLGEPIRNFGIGGYGAFQAYRRMLRTEPTEVGAEYLILNIWSIDDHLRSVDAWRWPRIFEWFRNPQNRNMFHANPWAHLRYDLDAGHWNEIESPVDSPEALYRLCEEDYVVERYKDDVVLHMFLGQRPDYDVDVELLRKVAGALDVPFNDSSSEARAASAWDLHASYGMRSSRYVVERAQEYADAEGKKLLVMLSCFSADIGHVLAGNERQDRCFVDWLKERGKPYIDMLPKHVEDYKAFDLSPKGYCDRYFIGHYNPSGNHFFAFAIKNDIVAWLDPKPFTYQAGDAFAIRFERYL